jgi:hypothetical protein
LETGGSPRGGLLWFRPGQGVAVTPVRRRLAWMPKDDKSRHHLGLTD